MSEDRLRVDNAMYRGQDKKGRPFSLSAGEAIQARASVPVVRMQDLTARLLLSDGPAVLSAPAGRYDLDGQRVLIDGVVSFVAADGSRLSARGVKIDLPERSLVSTGRVEGTGQAGDFGADGMHADLDTRTVSLDGNAKLRMVPGRVSIP